MDKRRVNLLVVVIVIVAIALPFFFVKFNNFLSNKITGFVGFGQAAFGEVENNEQENNAPDGNFVPLADSNNKEGYNENNENGGSGSRNSSRRSSGGGGGGGSNWGGGDGNSGSNGGGTSGGGGGGSNNGGNSENRTNEGENNGNNNGSDNSGSNNGNNESNNGNSGGGNSGGQGQNLNMQSSYSKYLRNGNLAGFSFLFNGYASVGYCDLYLDNFLRKSFLQPEFGLWNSLEIENVSAGKHDWKVICLDNSSDERLNKQGNAVFFKKSKYGGKSTDLSLIEDLSQVFNFTLENSQNGMVSFDMPLDLSNGIDFDKVVTISHNYIEIDSSAAPELNAPAIVSFYSVDVQHPVILRDGKACDECQILSNQNGNLIFRVNHFSSYTSSENSQLMIFDDTDNSLRYPGQIVSFFANYTNISNGQEIQGGGAYCNVTFEDSGTVNMPYNAARGLYEYNRTFSSAGVFSYNVDCYGLPLGFTNLDTNDDSVISPNINSNVKGANVSEIRTESAPSDSAGNDSAVAGNITELVVVAYSNTQTWQGYIGNVSGTIQLADSDDDVLYNWSLANPEGEIYASTHGGISWNDIQCFNFSATGNYSDETGNGGGMNKFGMNLSQLEGLYNIASDDVDGVDETFNLQYGGSGEHDSFFTAHQQFDEGECASTRVFSNAGMGENNKFEEVLLYDPLTRSVVFTSLLEEASVMGYDGEDHDFEMLVLEDGHGVDTSTTVYYFFTELE
jgi:hypothetical protein